jgi:hypothetical protein
MGGEEVVLGFVHRLVRRVEGGVSSGSQIHRAQTTRGVRGVEKGEENKGQYHVTQKQKT